MNSPLIIDTHAHLFKRGRDAIDLKNDYEIFEFGEKRDVHLSTMTGTVDEMLPAMAAAGIKRSIVLNLFIANWERDRYKRGLPGDMSAAECGRRMSQFEFELPEALKSFNRWGCEVACRHPQLLAYACTDLALLGPEESADHIRDMIENAGAVGLKLHGPAHNYAMSNPRLWPTLSVCRDFDVPIIAHSGSDSQGAGLADPRAFTAMLREFPDLTIVLAHLGGGSWRQTLEIAETYTNVYFDCCEIIEWTGGTNAPDDHELAKLIRDIGPDRVMMGSDFPWYDLDHTIMRVMELPLLSEEEKLGILGSNAVRILGIDADR